MDTYLTDHQDMGDRLTVKIDGEPGGLVDNGLYQACALARTMGKPADVTFNNVTFRIDADRATLREADVSYREACAKG